MDKIQTPCRSITQSGLEDFLRGAITYGHRTDFNVTSQNKKDLPIIITLTVLLFMELILFRTTVPDVLHRRETVGVRSQGPSTLSEIEYLLLYSHRQNHLDIVSCQQNYITSDMGYIVDGRTKLFPLPSTDYEQFAPSCKHCLHFVVTS